MMMMVVVVVVCKYRFKMMYSPDYVTCQDTEEVTGLGLHQHGCC